MDEIRKYIDKEGLAQFLENLKTAYGANTSTKFPVNFAKTAGKVAGTLTIKTKDSEDQDQILLDAWDGSSNAVITITGGGSIQPVQDVLVFRFAFGAEGLPVGYEPAKGDVIVCTEDVVEGQETIFKAGSEYLFDGTRWVELGGVIPEIDLSNYLTKTEAASTYETQADLATTLAEYSTTDQIAETYATKASVYTKNEVDSKIATALDDYSTSAEIEQTYLKRADAASTYATKKELGDHAAEAKAEADLTYVAKVDYVTHPEIDKMFPVDFVVEEGATPSEVTTAFGNAVTALGDGGALNVDTDVITPTTGVYGMVIGSSDGSTPVDVTFNLGEDASLTATSGARVFSVNPNSKVEIIGATNPEDPKPTVTGTADEPSIFIANNSSVTLEGIELSGENYSALQSNGLNENSDFYLKNCVIKGPCYMPACGNLIIEGCKFYASTNTSADAGALYVKSGSVTIRNSEFHAAKDYEHVGISGPWKHNNNGWNGIATALVLENCNYGKHGNLKIDIDADSTFEGGYCNTTAEDGKQYDNVGILVINYNGNHADACNIAQNYYEIDVTESAIGKHYFTIDGRGGTEQLTPKVPN